MSLSVGIISTGIGGGGTSPQPSGQILYGTGIANTSDPYFLRKSNSIQAGFATTMHMVMQLSDDYRAQLGDIQGASNNTLIDINDETGNVTMTNAVSTPTMEIYNGGSGVVTISSSVRGIYIDPALAINDLTINVPIAPSDGQEVLILFGGQIVAGSVVVILTIGGGTLVGAFLPNAPAGYSILLKYRSSNTTWYIIFQ